MPVTRTTGNQEANSSRISNIEQGIVFGQSLPSAKPNGITRFTEILLTTNPHESTQIFKGVLGKACPELVEWGRLRGE